MPSRALLSLYFFRRPISLTAIMSTNPERTPQRVGVFPGQFDPITNGHLDVIRRGVKLFDRLIVAVGVNPEKKEFFSISERVSMITGLVADLPAVTVQPFAGLTVDFVRQCNAHVILRGIRDVSDLRYEMQLALANRTVGQIETIFIMTGDQYALTSSSLIRQVISLGGDARQLRGVLPEMVIQRLQDLQRQGRTPGAAPDAPAV